MILMDKNLKMAHIIQLENKQNLYGPASLKTSQFNTKNPYIKYAEEAILNSPYYPYTSNPTKFLYATRFLRIFYFDLD